MILIETNFSDVVELDEKLLVFYVEIYYASNLCWFVVIVNCLPCFYLYLNPLIDR